MFQLVVGVCHMNCGRHRKATFAQAHFEHAQALTVGIDEEKALFGH